MKGWFNHGGCVMQLWPGPNIPKAKSEATQDGWQVSANRPLGAYYRVDTQAIADMHVALNEVGILYASAICHSGWSSGFNADPGTNVWTIAPRQGDPSDSGHAFAIVDYDQHGFFLLNSWETIWGSGGYARIRYEDWLMNAMHCWVAQPGVVTDQHREIAQARSLPMNRSGTVQLSPDVVLRNREISPFIIDVGNNGKLSRSGQFHTGLADIDALLNLHLDSALQAWGAQPNGEVDIAIYAHGGLTDESDAATAAPMWLPARYNAQIFPIFFMWETGAMETLRNMIAEAITGVLRQMAGIGAMVEKWWNTRLERMLANVGSAFWGKMKEHADMLSSAANSGGIELYPEAQRSAVLKKIKPRLHLIAHSAGSIVHSHMIAWRVDRGWRFKSLNCMAPAVTVEAFENLALLAVKAGKVENFHQFHLTDEAEQHDHTCGPYRRS